MNYFPYIALGLVALLGYLYINGLAASIRELESKNAMLKSEVKSANDSLDTMRRTYIETTRTLREYSIQMSIVQESMASLQTKLARDEKRLDMLAEKHPKLVEDAINKAVKQRLACIAAAARGQNVNENDSCN